MRALFEDSYASMCFEFCKDVEREHVFCVMLAAQDFNLKSVKGKKQNVGQLHCYVVVLVDP